MRTIVAIALFQGWVSTALAESPPPLTPIGAIARDGSRGLAAPVRVRGIVTYCDSGGQRLCIQDGDVGLVVRIPFDTRQFRPGQRVEVTGKAIANHSFNANDVRFLSDDAVPKVVPIREGDLAAGKLARLRVTTVAVIRASVVEGDHVILRALVGRLPIRVWIRGMPPGPLNLDRYIDAEVELTGVCGTPVVAPSPAVGEELLVQSFDDVQVVRPAPESPFALTPVSAKEIPTWTPHRVRVSGTATGPVQDGILTLHVEGRPVQVSVSANLVAHAGERFDAVGFASLRNGVPLLEEALIRGYARPAKPLPSSELLPIIQSVRDIRRMPPSEAAKGYPIRLRATVTYYSPFVLFVHDGGEGIFVVPPQLPKPLSGGDIVQVDGYTDSGDFAPTIRAERVALVRNGRLPAARRYSYDELVGGRADSQWVEVEAAVRGTSTGDYGEGLLMLRLGSATTPARIAAADPASLGRLFGATVRIRAVCGSTFNPRRQWTGVLFHIPSVESIQIVQPAPPDLSVLEPRTIESLSQFDPERRSSEPVKLTGRVLSRRHDTILLQDTTGGIAVDLQPRQKCAAGDRVDVLGFPIYRANGWAMEDSLSRILSSPDDSPGPIDVTPSEAAGGNYAATMIRVEAVLLEQFSAGDSDYVLLLQSIERRTRPA